MKKIVLTGGGTAGHVTPNIALLPALREAGFEVLYIGSYEGMERKLIEETGTPYRGISSGKLRRYFDWKNFTDPFRVLKGYSEAKAILREFRPDLVFSKGGYVAVPVVRAAKRLGIPAVIHESDMTPGLANRLSYSAATKICCNFPETLSLLPKDKAVLTGSPIRAELLSGSREAAYERTGFTTERPVLLVIGGSLGSRAVNAAVREALPELLKEFQVLHIAGKNNLDPTLSDTAKASRGDQILNARSYEKQGYSRVLEEEALSRETLLAAIRETYADRARYLAAMEAGGSADGVAQVMSVLNSVTAGRR